MGKNDEENSTSMAVVQEQPQADAPASPAPTAPKAKEGEVLPPSVGEDLREIQSTTALIGAIGQQLQVIIQTPGVEGFLKGLGEERSANAELVTMNAKNQHEQQMERERRESASQAEREKRETESLARKETFAVRWIYLLTVIIPFWFFGLAIMVSKEMLTSAHAATLTMFVTLVVTAMRSIFAKSQSSS